MSYCRIYLNVPQCFKNICMVSSCPYAAKFFIGDAEQLAAARCSGSRSALSGQVRRSETPQDHPVENLYLPFPINMICWQSSPISCRLRLENNLSLAIQPSLLYQHRVFCSKQHLDALIINIPWVSLILFRSQSVDMKYTTVLPLYLHVRRRVRVSRTLFASGLVDHLRKLTVGVTRGRALLSRRSMCLPR